MNKIPARLWTLAALSGLLQILPFPIAGPTPAWRTSFCWVALIPLLSALLAEDKQGRPLRIRQGAALGYLSGIIWYLGNCYWIYQTMYLYGGLPKPVAAGILVLFCFYLGLYHLLFGALIVILRLRLGHRCRALVLSPFVWVAVELARAHITGFPWDLLGISQVNSSLACRLAPYTGAYGVSFAIVVVNAVLITFWLTRSRIRHEQSYRRRILAMVAVGLVVYFFPFITKTNPGRARATLVQENLEIGALATERPTLPQMLESFSYLSLNTGDSQILGIPGQRNVPKFIVPLWGRSLPTNVIVWPESPASFQEDNPQFRTALSSLARKANAPIIAGSIAVIQAADNPRGYFLLNSAAFVTPQGEFAGRYDKMHLVPFGEYVPFQRLFFFAGSLLQDVGDFKPGTNRTIFSVNGHHYGTFICYESIFGDEVRHFVQQGAEVLVNISNDGWYGDTSAPWQHLDMVRMRAIENHRWILRATNTGITASIDPAGRVVLAAPRHVRTSIQVGFNYENKLTFYTKHGDLFAYGCALVTLLALAYGMRRRLAVNYKQI